MCLTLSERGFGARWPPLPGAPFFSLLRFSGIYFYLSDFTYAAKTYGRIIISEIYLPVEEKTIKPATMGGIAGGEKFIASSILLSENYLINNSNISNWF